MSDCRKARVRLRRRLETKYPINRVSAQYKDLKKKQKIDDLNIEQKKVPVLKVTVDLNHRKKEFIKEEYFSLIEENKNFLVKVDYFEDEYCNYKIAFLLDNINIGLERIKKYAVTEIIENVVIELERVYREMLEE